jgi:hypothetical protein
MRRIVTTAFSVALLLIFSAAAQEPAAPKKSAPGGTRPAKVRKPAKKELQQKFWRRWASLITDDVVEDDWRLNSLDAAVLQARLCSAWWQSDRTRARAWCELAVDRVSRTPLNEPTDARRERVAAGRTVLRLVTPLDTTLRDQVEDSIKLALAAEQESPTKQPGALAATLAQAALDQADNPPRMAQLIGDSLRQGGSAQTVLAILKLREKDPEKANELFTEAAALASQSQDPGFLAYLVTAGFPGIEPESSADVPDQWRYTSLQTLATNLAIPARSELESKRRCDWLTERLYTINEKFPQAVPDATLAQLDYCSPHGPTPHLPPLPDDLKASDDFVRAAKGYPAAMMRQQLKLTAAMMADGPEENPERAPEILESITPEEQNARPGQVWPHWNPMAVRAVLASKDMSGRRNILDRTPDRWRGEVEVRVLEEGVPKRFGWLEEIISRCGADLRRYGTYDPNTYIRFLNLALKYQWPNREHILFETMKNLDAWKPKEIIQGEKNPIPYYPPLERLAAPLPINPNILELDPERLRAISSEVDKVLLRTSFRLSLLLPALARARGGSAKP